jgi:hypothetical protein
MNLMTILIVVLLGIASVAALVGLGAIIYQLLFRKRKPEAAKQPPPLTNE